MTEPAEGGKAVAVSGLTQRFGPVTALDAVDLEVGYGEIVALLGPNGAGKSTALDAIAGLTVPRAGSIMIKGMDARRSPKAARLELGVSPQRSALPEAMTVGEALTLFGRFYPEHVPTAELLERFGLEACRTSRFAALSRGQQQSLSLALAFIGRPRVLILDEATTALDAAMRGRFWEEVTTFREGGGAVLLATHDIAEAKRVCDRTIAISAGKIVAVSSAASALAGTAAPMTILVVTATALSARDMVELKLSPGPAGSYSKPSHDPLADVSHLSLMLQAKGIDLVELRVARSTLAELTGTPASVERR